MEKLILQLKPLLSLLMALIITSCGGDDDTPDPPPVIDLNNITISNGPITLGGALILPDGPGPHPAVIVVHGSGPADRFNSSDYATQLLPDRGIAVLIYDKRGVGQSTGIYRDVGPSNSEEALGQLASDALAWVGFLQQQEAIDPNRIGMTGVSQAGWIMPLAAAQSPDVAFIINIVGATCSVGEEIFYSSLTQEQQYDENRMINGKTVEELNEEVKTFSGEHGFDPIPSIRELDIPALWIFGEMDESIPTQYSMELLQQVIDEGGKDFTVHFKPNGNHALQHFLTGEQIGFVLSEEGIVTWLNQIL